MCSYHAADLRLCFTYIHAESRFSHHAAHITMTLNSQYNFQSWCELISVFSMDSDYISLVMRKPGFCICEKKVVDQLRDNRAS